LVVLIAALLLLPIAGIGVAHAQTDETLRANIPFTFHAGNQVMSAGTYEFAVDLQDKLVTIADDSGRNRMMMVATSSSDGSKERDQDLWNLARRTVLPAASVVTAASC